MDTDHPVEDSLAAVTRHFLHAMDQVGWDAPAQIAALDVRPMSEFSNVPATDDLALAWEVTGPVPVYGHPFASVLAIDFPDDAIGVLFAVEGWMNAAHAAGDTGDDPLLADVAAHAGDDGRTEIRMAIALLADGTSAQFCQVRHGSLHPFHGEFAGRLPDALSLLVHRNTATVPCEDPAEICSRAWCSMALAVAALATDHPELPDDLDPALASLVATTSVDVARLALPAWFTWLPAHANHDWSHVLDRLRRAIVEDHFVGWLLAASTEPEVLDDWGDDDERRARDRLDASMLAMLATSAVPTAEEIAAAFTTLVTARGLDLSLEDLESLAHIAVAALATST